MDLEKFWQDFGGCVVEVGGGGIRVWLTRTFAFKFSFLANLAIVRNPSSVREEKDQLLCLIFATFGIPSPSDLTATNNLRSTRLAHCQTHSSFRAHWLGYASWAALQIPTDYEMFFAPSERLVLGSPVRTWSPYHWYNEDTFIALYRIQSLWLALTLSHSVTTASRASN